MGGGSKTTSESGSAQKWAQPFAQQAAGNVQSVFNQNQPQLQQITQGITSLLPGLSQRFTQGTPTLNAAKDLTQQTLGGSFLSGSNPYLQSVIDQTKRGVADTVNSQFSLGGRYGSGAHTGALTQQLANAEGGLRYQDYGTERGYQNQAIGQAGALEGIDNASLAALLQAAGVGAELPYTGTNALSGGLGSLFSGGTQTQKGPGLLSQLIGTAGQVGSAAMMASDPRLKENIRLLGTLPDGLNVYEYDYIAAPNDEIAAHMPEGHQIGVMTDEVAALRPWALGPEIGGYMTVNYGAL